MLLCRARTLFFAVFGPSASERKYGPGDAAHVTALTLQTTPANLQNGGVLALAAPYANLEQIAYSCTCHNRSKIAKDIELVLVPLDHTCAPVYRIEARGANVEKPLSWQQALLILGAMQPLFVFAEWRQMARERWQKSFV